jgi:hypothetical protein
MTRIECLADAFSRLNGYHDPFSIAYKNRNPGLLKAFSLKHTKDENGFRVFNSFSSGYDNLCQDLLIKCSGASHSRLKTTDTLKDLVKFFGNDAAATRGVKNFLRHALHDDTILESQPLGWFIEDRKKNDCIFDTKCEKQ